MSVTYLFVGGPSHGALIAWPEDVPEIMVPVSLSRTMGIGEYGENATLPPPSQMYGREYYRTEDFWGEPYGPRDNRRHMIKLAIHEGIPHAERSQFTVLDNQKLLIDALLRNAPGSQEFRLSGWEWVGA